MSHRDPGTIKYSKTTPFLTCHDFQQEDLSRPLRDASDDHTYNHVNPYRQDKSKFSGSSQSRCDGKFSHYEAQELVLGPESVFGSVF